MGIYFSSWRTGRASPLATGGAMRIADDMMVQTEYYFKQNSRQSFAPAHFIHPNCKTGSSKAVFG